MVLESNQLVDIITQNVNTIVIVINQNGELIYISKSVERILGYLPEELLGEYWWKATQKDHFSALDMIESIRNLVKLKEFDQEKLTSESMLFDTAGNKKWILWNSSRDENGNIVSVGYDITSRKKNEAKLKKANLLLKAKNKEVLDSLKYAQSIQNAFLPSKTFFKEKFANGFVFYQPKDFVSGDFYWTYEFEELYFVACIDCTGHGVPGALMTILANSLLKSVVKHQKLKDPSEILFALDSLLYEEFNKNNKTKRSDGMDISLCVFDFNKDSVLFSGANQSLYYNSKKSKEIQEFKGKRYPIGLYHDVQKQFTTEKIEFQKGDHFFMLSDGILDQFGGEKDKKFTKKRFMEGISKGQGNISEIQYIAETEFINWKGIKEQTDDVLVIGIEI